MKPKTGVIKVRLEVMYYDFETRPQACHERCHYFHDAMMGTTCHLYGRLERQRMPGRNRYAREQACIDAEKDST